MSSISPNPSDLPEITIRVGAARPGFAQLAFENEGTLIEGKIRKIGTSLSWLDKWGCVQLKAKVTFPDGSTSDQLVLIQKSALKHLEKDRPHSRLPAYILQLVDVQQKNETWEEVPLEPVQKPLHQRTILEIDEDTQALAELEQFVWEAKSGVTWAVEFIADLWDKTPIEKRFETVVKRIGWIQENLSDLPSEISEELEKFAEKVKQRADQCKSKPIREMLISTKEELAKAWDEVCTHAQAIYDKQYTSQLHRSISATEATFAYPIDTSGDVTKLRHLQATLGYGNAIIVSNRGELSILVWDKEKKENIEMRVNGTYVSILPEKPKREGFWKDFKWETKETFSEIAKKVAERGFSLITSIDLARKAMGKPYRYRLSYKEEE